MTERQWLTSTDTVQMYRWLRGMMKPVSERKLRLFDEACAVHPHRPDAVLLRCIIGNPWQPVTLARAEEDVPELIQQLHPQHWPRVRWLTPTVVNIAQGIYDDCDWDHLPVLADALEEAGCTDAAVLDHLRNKPTRVHGGTMLNGELLDNPQAYVEVANERHARGCWVLDLILGRE